MVLVHKLKQMEELDIEQFRDTMDEDGRSIISDQDERSDGGRSVDPISPQKKRAHSPPRRPLTRSQTGHTSKRRLREEYMDEKPKRSPSSLKATKPSRKRPVDEIEAEVDTPEQKNPTPPLPQRDASETPLSVETPPTTPTTQITFLESSASGTTLDRRGPRSRATLPVPVPNLTKKSRGRRVPTKTVAEKDEAQKEARLYVCNVEDCGKCFHRGEHLKRHIRSIHTHEKPFKCSHPACYKFFNRHDNLLQHLKVHKDLPTFQPPPEGSLSTGPLQAIQKQPHSPSSRTNDPFVSSPQQPTATRLLPPPYVAYSTNTLYSSTSDSTGFATNMAVSSLRTEMPHSPPLSRGMPHDTITRGRYHAAFNGDNDNERSPALLLRPTEPHDWQA